MKLRYVLKYLCLKRYILSTPSQRNEEDCNDILPIFTGYIKVSQEK
jgi:hypothetical protein